MLVLLNYFRIRLLAIASSCLNEPSHLCCMADDTTVVCRSTSHIRVGPLWSDDADFVLAKPDFN
jgi:hypothetical protein